MDLTPQENIQVNLAHAETLTEIQVGTGYTSFDQFRAPNANGESHIFKALYALVSTVSLVTLTQFLLLGPMNRPALKALIKTVKGAHNEVNGKKYFPNHFKKSEAYKKLCHDKLYGDDEDICPIYQFYLEDLEKALAFPTSKGNHSLDFLCTRLALQMGIPFEGTPPPASLPENLHSAWLGEADNEDDDSDSDSDSDESN